LISLASKSTSVTSAWKNSAPSGFILRRIERATWRTSTFPEMAEGTIG
jgi:hypothetical protein